jgi:arginyl-tRNA synthetase
MPHDLWLAPHVAWLIPTMQTIQQQLQTRVDAALRSTLEDAGIVAPDVLQVVPCANPQFGDYQFNGALPLAKALKTNPRALAQQIVAALDVSTLSEAPEIAGPGFINFRLKREFVEAMIAGALADPRLGVPTASQPRRVVVDFSAPNVAKPMHVGHIRSTIIGAAITRLLRFSGHTVFTDNHIGDWGTQFGKLILGWKQHLDAANLATDPIGEMERLYRLVNAASEADEAVANAARAEVAKLQNGDAENLRIWEQLRALSQNQFDEIYGRLGVEFDETLGESFYNDRLPQVVSDLKAQGLAEDSEGAVVVRFESPQLADKPLLIQKSDGAYNYGTTDLATIQYRVERWQPQEILYVVDVRQSLHFQQLFDTARRWGYNDVALRHISFGTILGEDGTPIKTRSGETIKLRDLLDEAQQRALAIVRDKNPDLSETQQREIARVIGIGAVKYSDLSQNRSSDILFSWDKMLAMQGNTAPYLQYAYVRVRSIFRRAGIDNFEVPSTPVLEHPAELDLAKHLLRFALAIDTALSDYRINAISDYIFELAQKFSVFFESCPVLKSESPVRESRLALCDLTAGVLRQGLNLLGIETIEQM